MRSVDSERGAEERVADSAIRGFLYQFLKTLDELLTVDDAEITVEGVIEDIDIEGKDEFIGIQCKYHECNGGYSPSLLYKPMLLFLRTWKNRKNVKFVLYIYAGGEEVVFSRADLLRAIESRQVKYKKIIQEMGGAQDLDLDSFLDSVSIVSGVPISALEGKVCSMLKVEFPSCAIYEVVFPNAIHLIHKMAIKKNISDRKIRKFEFINLLRDIDEVVLSAYSLRGKSRNLILKNLRERIKESLSGNSYLRCIYLDKKSIVDFESGIVSFLVEFVRKYSSKKVHLRPPLFCLDCTVEMYTKIVMSVRGAGFDICSGLVADGVFDQSMLCADPVVSRHGMSFRLRMFRSEQGHIPSCRFDYSYVFSDEHRGPQGVGVVFAGLGGMSFSEIKYILRLSHAV